MVALYIKSFWMYYASDLGTISQRDHNICGDHGSGRGERYDAGDALTPGDS